MAQNPLKLWPQGALIALGEHNTRQGALRFLLILLLPLGDFQSQGWEREKLS